jgi:glutathione S-transferase
LPSRSRVKGTRVPFVGACNSSLRQRCSPYFGQSAWFQHFHAEKIPSAIERYNNEIKRVFSVLDSVLSKQKYLVGDKVTIADLAFIPWNSGVLKGLVPDIDAEKNYPDLAR